MASRNGRPSMSPVVPPISVMTTSALALFGQQMDAVLDLVRDVRDHLHGLAEIFPLALVVQHGLVNLAAGQIVHARELDVREPLVMAEVEVRLRAVIQHIHFAVLIRDSSCPDPR